MAEEIGIMMLLVKVGGTTIGVDIGPAVETEKEGIEDI